MLAAASIDYRHEPSLGSPSDVRNRLKKNWDYKSFFAAYERHLDKQTAILDESSELEGRVALLCYERNPAECHRRSVAERIAESTGLKIRHLGVRTGLAVKDDSGLDARQSVSPT